MPPRSTENPLAPFHALLGTVPDQQIATKAKVSRALVVSYRKKLGIPAYQGYKFGHAGVVAPLPVALLPVAPAAVAPAPAQPAPVGPAPTPAELERAFRGRKSALDPFAHLLGKTSDVEIARMAGVTTENVRTYRQRRSIEPSWQGGAIAPEPKATPSAAKIPEVKAPEAKPAKAPEAKPAKAPEAKPAAAKAPAVKAPEVKAPAVKAPEVRAPEVKASEAKPAPEAKPAAAKAPEAKPAAAKAPEARPAAAKPPVAPPVVAAAAKPALAALQAPEAKPAPEAKAPVASPVVAEVVARVAAKAEPTAPPVTASKGAPAPDSTPATTAFLVVVETEQGAHTYAVIATDIATAASVALARLGLRQPSASIRSIQRVAEVLS